jgi:hypothetical protein
MAASILVLIVGSFACWCAWQCFKLQENSKQENLKDDDARDEDLRRRFKDVELPTDWTKSITPSVSPPARNQADRQKSSAAPSAARSRPSSTVSAIRKPRT